MAIKPIDVRRKEFKNSLRGYDANQVDDFLDQVADEFERAYSENARMREEISGLRERLQQFSDLEGSIRAALVHAEQAASDVRESANREAETVRESARREAELTINEAKSRAHQMLAESSARVERVQSSYEALREAKQTFANDFRRLLKGYMDVMDNADVQSAREIESSLRDRLDTESIAVAREAAAHSSSSEGSSFEDSSSEREQPTLIEEPAGHETGESETLPDEAPAREEGDEEETRAFTPEDMAAAQGLSHPPRGADGPGTYEPFESSAEERPASESGTGPLSTEDEGEAPEATEPEVEPSTVRGEDTPDSAGATAASDEPAPDADDTQEQQGASDEDERYDAFFDRGDRSGEAPREQEGRISRASRFLRRRA